MTTEPNDPKIDQLLDQLRQVPPRDRQAAIRGRGRFLAQAASLRNTQPIRTPKNRLAMLFSPSWLYRKQKFAMFVTFILVLAVLFSGTGLTAYAAQDSLPGEVLYPVKTAVEDVRLGLTTDPSAEYALLDQYLTTRFEELDALNAAGEPLNSAFANRLLLQLDQMLRIAASQSDADMIENLDHLYIRLMDQDRLSWYDDDQEGEVYGVGLQLREEIVTRARLITQGTEDPVEFRLELQNRTQTNIPVDAPPDAPVGEPGGYGPGEPSEDTDQYGVNGSGTGAGVDTTTGTGTGTSQAGTAQPYYYFPGQGGMGTGQKGKP
jgi:hypothetical protein